jgi:hypothetical protein
MLRSEGSNKWTGTIAPFAPQYELYVTFVRNAAGTLGGFIRDPIGDFETIAPFETVAIDADNITITTRAHVLHGSVDAMASAIVLSIGTGPPLHFYRLNPNLSNGYSRLIPAKTRRSAGRPRKAAAGGPTRRRVSVWTTRGCSSLRAT